MSLNNRKHESGSLNSLLNSLQMTLQVQLPSISALTENEIKIILAGELYERKKLSLGQSANVAGLSKRAFVEIMGKYGYSLFSKSVDDFLSDVKNA